MFCFAQVSSQATTLFRLGRIQENQDFVLPVIVLFLLVWFFISRYRKDAAELRLWQRCVLATLRLVAIVTLFVYFLHPQWEHLVGSSRVAVLVDTSASMANRDLLPHKANEVRLRIDGAEENEHDEEIAVSRQLPTRLEGVLDWLDRSELVKRLLENHDVAVYAFDKSTTRLFVERKPIDPMIRALQAANDTGAETTAEDAGDKGGKRLDQLVAEGDETRLGEALLEVLQRERGQPLAGVVVLTDGGQNAGTSLDAPLEIAGRNQVPIYPIGIGPKRLPLNVRIAGFDLPERAFPDDPFTVKAAIELVGGEQSSNTEMLRVPVELWLSEPSPNDSADNRNKNAVPVSESGQKIGEAELRLSSGQTLEQSFNVKIDTAGKHRLVMKIIAPEDDFILDDNRQENDVDVVTRKDRVLLFASGPMRDYQFLATQLYRDKSTSVDVYLPWAKPGISQSADKLLERFPTTRNEMSEYDALVAFDPNWRDLSTEQIQILDHWLSSQGGGLMIVAGTIYQSDAITGWVTDATMDKIRAMYPVEFSARTAVFDHRYHSGQQAYPLTFTPSGQESQFLQVKDTVADSRAFWSEFQGFYGYFAVKAVKPTATLLATTKSPDAIGRGESGALLVEQFYGAGRVLYVGSPELWRLRRQDDKVYERLTTQMLRYVSQGRLQRESDRGTLALDKRNYMLGTTAKIHVTATDGQQKPLDVPMVPVEIVLPNGMTQSVPLVLDANVPGSYYAHLPLTAEGTWSVQFTIPQTTQTIVKTFQVQMSQLERENPSRNEPLLKELAEKSRGRYYASPIDALDQQKESSLFGNIAFFVSENGDEVVPKLTELLTVRSQRAVPDRQAEERLFCVLLSICCGALLLEWTLRRLMRLA